MDILLDNIVPLINCFLFSAKYPAQKWLDFFNHTAGYEIKNNNVQHDNEHYNNMLQVKCAYKFYRHKVLFSYSSKIMHSFFN